MPGLTEYSQTYKPFRYPWAMEIAEQHEKIHWGSWEAKLQEDVNQWKNGDISSEEKRHITQILRIFTQSDVAVGGNYSDVFIQAFKNNEIRNMLLSFANREGTHQRSYALLNDTLGLAEKEYSVFLKYKEMADKIHFMTQPPKNMKKKDQHLAFELARSVCNEGMTKLFHAYLEEKPHLVTDTLKSYIYTNFERAVELEDALIDFIYSEVQIEGLTSDELKVYIRYLADRRLLQLGMKPIFKQKDNPLLWVDWIVSGDSFKNFFEGTVTDYNASGMIGDFDTDIYLNI